MKRLRKKYLDNTITKEELLVLCQYEEKASDENLEKDLLLSWLESDAKKVFQEESKVAEIEKKIMEKLRKANKFNQIKKGLKYVALFVGPFLMLSILLLCLPISSEDVSDAIITTKKGERVNVVLPDGTHVVLNSESELRYNALSFNKEMRLIHFTGEGFFEVKENKKRPFVLISGKMNLKVLGTKFCISNRKESEKIEVFLKNGNVVLTSEISPEIKKLAPNDKAIFYKEDGSFIVNKGNSDKDLEWLENKLIFKKVPLDIVLRRVESHYKVKIVKKGIQKYHSDSVTIVLPSNNINEVLKVLSKVYKKKVFFDGNKIQFYSY